MTFGSALCQIREAASPTGVLMSLNLSRNAVAMERALGFLADAERALEDCSSCLASDVIVSEAQAAEHNRSIVEARNALHALRGQIRSEHEEVCRHLRDAQLSFLQSKPLISLATGYTGCNTHIARELDLSALIYEPVATETRSDDAGVPALSQGTLMPIVSSSSGSQRMVVQSGAGSIEDTHECGRLVNSSLASALHDDDDETVKGLSDDGLSYAGTVVRGVLRGDSE